MIRVLIPCFFLFLLAAWPLENFAKEQQEKLIFNMINQKELPRGFRTTANYYSSEIIKRKGIIPSDTGLKSLRISGSAQFSKDALAQVFNTVEKNRKNITVVDLRQEVHGFVNDHAVSWYAEKNWGNMSMSPREIEVEQGERLLDLLHLGSIDLFLDKKSSEWINLKVNYVENEEEVARDLGADYVRFYVTDHTRPEDKTVDEFLAFVKTMPKNMWLHFHCKGGKGRTTTFMAMYDMMHNASEVSFQDIVLRQWYIGGMDLSCEGVAESWKSDYARERLNFLRLFYAYSQENPTFEKSWTDWIISCKK